MKQSIGGLADKQLCQKIKDRYTSTEGYNHLAASQRLI